MKSAITLGPRAEEDVLEIADFFAREAGADVANRFLVAVYATIRSLQAMPGRGSPRLSERAELASLRVLHVRGFESYALFYRCGSEAITIDRILHGARDIGRILRDDDEFGAVHEAPSEANSVYAMPIDTAVRVAC